MARASPAVVILLLATMAGTSVSFLPATSACQPATHPCLYRCTEGDVTFDSCRDSQQKWAADGVTYLVGVLDPEEMNAHVLSPGQSYAPGTEGAIYVRAEWADGQQRLAHNATFALTAFDESLEWMGPTRGVFSFSPASNDTQELLFRFRVKEDAASDRAAIPFRQEGPSGSHADALRVTIEQRQPGSLFGLSPDASLGLMALLGLIVGVLVVLVWKASRTRALPPDLPAVPAAQFASRSVM